MQYSQRRQLDAMDRALFEHYKKNPQLLEEHRKRSIIESLAATGLGSMLGKGIQTNPTKPWGFLPVIVGASAGASAHFVGQAARRRQALLERGIDTDLLGSYAKPINDIGEEYFK